MRQLHVPDETAKKLGLIAHTFDVSDIELLNALLDLLNKQLPTAEKRTFSEWASHVLELSPIRSSQEVMGGDACIRSTRIPVWSLVQYKQEGLTDSQILTEFPVLNASDLSLAWEYYAAHPAEIEAQRKRHEEAA